MLRSSAALALLGAAACAGGAAKPAPAPAPATATVMQQAAAAQPPAPSGIDPAGTYEVTTVAQGATVTFTTKIHKNADGSYGGTVASMAYGEMAIQGLTVTGKRVDFSVSTADGTPVGIYFVLDGSTVVGEWAAGTDGYKLTGKKLP